MLVAAHGERGSIGVDRPTQSLRAAAQRERVTSRRQLHLTFFDDRNSVFRVVVSVAPAEVALRAGPRQADVAEAIPRLRVREVALRRGHVTRSTAAAARVQRDRAVAHVHVAGGRGFVRSRTQIEREVAARAHLRFRGDLVGDHVHQTADGVRAVEQRRRTAHDLDPLRGSRVDRHAVIARLTREVAETLAVLENQHAVAVETANDGPGRRRPEAPGGDARLALQRRTQRHLELLRQLLPRQHGRRLERLELAAGVGTHRQHFLEVQLRIDEHVERRGGRTDRHLAFGATNSPGPAPRGGTSPAPRSRR